MRTKQFNIRLSSVESQALNERAKAAGQSVSAYARLKMGLSDSIGQFEKRLIDFGLSLNKRQFILSVCDETAISEALNDETALSQLVDHFSKIYEGLNHASIYRAGDLAMSTNTGAIR